MNLKRIGLAVAALLFCVMGLRAQAPAQPPGYTVSINLGYTSLQNVGNANGFFSSLALPLHTFPATNWTTTVALRADNFLIASPSVNTVFLGPEFRFQFSQANLLGGEVFQPFVNAMLGEARSSCAASASCGAGVNASTHFAQKLGGGLDMITSAHVTLRLFEYDYLHSTLFPGGSLQISNWGQLLTGVGFTF